MCAVGDVLSVISICKDIVTKIWPLVRDCVRYEKILDDIKNTLEHDMKTLTAHEEEINRQITDKLAHVERPAEKKPMTKPTVDTWLENVKATRRDVEDKLKEANERCFGRSKFLRLVRDKITDVNKVIVACQFPEGLFDYVHQDRLLKFPTRRLVGQSINGNKKTILDSVKNGTSVGVWGMGGSGKTTIMEHVNNELLENGDAYGPVYWVSASEDSNIDKLQFEIATILHLQDFPKEENKQKERAALLSEKLTNKGKFVLILDNMWDAFPPDKVGIPISVNGGKLILTSRSKSVCYRMGCQPIRVERLAEDEAWDLFTERLERKDFTSDVKEYAESIVKACCGLPLAIITVAGSMKEVKAARLWRNALNKFKEFSKGLDDNTSEDMKSEVIKCLKFSYERLKNDNLKKCFLYCALFPKDCIIKKKYLIMCWIAEEFVAEMRTRQDEFDEGYHLLDALENACMLECTRDFSGENCVKMHDLIRDMALEIKTRDGQFMVQAGVQLIEEVPNKRHWSEDLERVSLMDSKITSPFSCISPKCPKLCTLMLQSIRHINEIPHSLFSHLQNLKVLDLSYLDKVERLPDSISNLEKLRALLLRGCEKLGYVPSLAYLKELRELDLQGTNIEKLPQGLEELVNLRSLLLMFKTIDDEQVTKISNLVQLEVLFVIFDNLHLFTRYVKTKHVETDRQRRLSLYILQIGSKLPKGYDEVCCRQVYIRDSKLIERVEDPLVLPTRMQEFWIENCHDLTSLSDITSLNNVNELKRCRIESCDGIEQLSSWPVSPSLQNLSTVMLVNLKNLRVIFKFEGAGVGGSGTFSNLKLLIVAHCPNLKYVLTHMLVQHHLQNLEVIHVSLCPEMENIIVAEEEENEGEIVAANEKEVKCSKLQRLELGYLPKLKNIWSGTMFCPSLQQIQVRDCPMLKRLPLSSWRSEAPSTLQLRGPKDWWDSVVWHLPYEKPIFQRLFAPHPEGTARPFWMSIEAAGDIWDDDLKRYDEN